MPRQARIDFPGLLHHVIARGLERRRIFFGPADYADFLERVQAAHVKHPNHIFAWALMPNHFHLLVRAGPRGISPFMHSLMTGYAVAFNRRHRRSGYLFQNRFKSIVCDEDSYFTELVRYIHLNPLRSGLVKTLDELSLFPYCGHGVILGNRTCPWQNIETVLAAFGARAGDAQGKYLAYLADGIDQGRRPDLTGGGLRKSLGIGRSSLPSRSTKQAYDSRVLGPGEFVESVLKQVEGEDVTRARLRHNQVSLEQLGKRVAEKVGVGESSLYKPGRTMGVSLAKAVFIHMGVEFLGRTAAEMAKRVSLSPGAASRSRPRAAHFIQSNNFADWL